MSRAASSAASSAAPSVPSAPAAASWITGRSSTDPVTTCGSTSAGSWFWMRVTAVCSCWLAASMSVP
ncbi:hypothetical protein [Cellulosimicrobium sp. CUA-896]|uniref:hypothetical protein n=1 Tax=Cellulosimicrobium sp. CUA-896 TaxID=1517881 RepID=UPI0009638C1A|nr:hypothetical protein [Cellulosimicrobium sp. CUA-896]OLT55320.1 hypothetical protein BJF88_06730 [Cellulosimicrobium sp. CUA-896]